jgi:catechol 2,3-dioxygenase-like lactoylglutathione lyase family enzyme
MLWTEGTWVIQELTLSTQNLKDMTAFYAVTLGLSVTFDDSSFSVQIGETKLIFRDTQESLPSKYHYAFNIPRNQMSAAKSWISEKLDLIHSDSGQDQFYFESWDSESIYFYDADQNVVELIARQAVNVESAEPFSAGELICVSEIGIASNSYLEMVHSMRFPIYGTSTQDFAAVGSPTGLLIFVQEGREWFPDTGIIALPMPVIVTLVSPYSSLYFKYPPDDGDLGIGVPTPVPQPPPRTGNITERFPDPKFNRERGLAIR